MIVPNDATLCGAGPHRSLGGSISAAEACPQCGGKGWYVTARALARRSAMAKWDAEHPREEPGVDGITDDMLDGITLAMQEEAERMGLTEPAGA